ncbi:hypothetical protein SEA_RUDY_16 [Microbacterium phage Rudy]|uniref:Uncharacterized protein n=1 Tax=Microbacterium phage Judebell TaxID=3230835 RepID=A0AAU8EIG3_9CAUD|nr:hypothetical protein SEA_RUDY_16 [Microbacterium phage Rudy]QWY80402.1 hypothetical protein SEA_TEEHEE_19 [Microbacterium phage Teehee]QWY80505.1 hypothetical protein SEA_QUAMMI_16 [Microbacterium phage Quammi]QXN73413.1 hypothetical protein SEA_JEHOSHAPHAT_20 [Microbacterium phage Jehoshaphat]QXN73942.1 hypothetical protein SEA_BLAB_15 [Microbacterium phage Blab]UVG33862.1 hypothetical protein SEA_VICEROY_17 [Microbacterium phage Viceroy]UVG34276.1 hypothetical protein SEA_GRASSBOY_19 [Mi
MKILCGYCERLRALGAPRIAVHLHYTTVEGILVTDHFSDGSRQQRTIWGARIEGRVL